jgi:two-component system aerobic respiration control sensor histidine kinase ArcB
MDIYRRMNNKDQSTATKSILMNNPDNFLLEKIIHHSPQFIAWKDLNHIFLGCNANFAKFVDLNSPHEIIGKTDYDLNWQANGTTPDFIQAKDQDVIRGEQVVNLEQKLVRPDGRTMILLTNKVPLFDNKNHIVGILVLATDITQRKYQEELKDRFIRNMEHDIRTPFNGIYGLSTFLVSQEPDLQKKSMLQDIANCAKELLEYCNDILQFSQIERGLFPVKEKAFNLKQLVQQIITMELPAAMNKNIDLVFHYEDQLSELILSDSYRIRTILLNLVSNAIKFTPSGNVDVSIGIAQVIKQNRDLIIQLIVKDSGAGISEQVLDFIYEKFTTETPSNKTPYKGQGLGLRVVKQFVSELEGDIHHQTRQSQGSMFTVLLPIKIPLSNDLFDE